MGRFITLASSSSGNCYFAGTSKEGILIDAGITNKKICDRLNAVGINPDIIKAVFVTHEHSDHTLGLRVFAEKHDVTVYASGGTLSAIGNYGGITYKMKCEKLHSGETTVGSMKVLPFRTSHDAKEPNGYIISFEDDRKIGICTDNGVMTQEIIDLLSDCDICLLESNYDEDMLRNGPYDVALKNRIKSNIGHMSNDECAKTALSLLSGGKCRNFILGHVSPHNNTPELAFSCTNSLLKHRGYEIDCDYCLQVAPVDSMNKILFF